MRYLKNSRVTSVYFFQISRETMLLLTNDVQGKRLDISTYSMYIKDRKAGKDRGLIMNHPYLQPVPELRRYFDAMFVIPGEGKFHPPKST